MNPELPKAHIKEEKFLGVPSSSENEIRADSVIHDGRKYTVGEEFSEEKINQIMQYLIYFNNSIKNFNLSYDERSEIADRLLEKNPVILCSRIKDFNFSSDKLLEIADRILEKTPLLICHYIKDFNFSSDKLLEIADQALDKNPQKFCHYIKDFNFSPEKLSEIADRLLEKTPSLLCSYIKDFNFSSEKLSEIVDRILEKDPYLICFRIKDFNLSPEKLSEIADRLLEKDIEVLSCDIKDFNFSADKCSEIAYRILDKNPGVLCCDINNFTLTDIKRFDIAVEIAKKDPRSLVQEIDKFHFKDQEELLILLRTGILHHPLIMLNMTDKDCCSFLKENGQKILEAHPDLLYFFQPEKVLDESSFQLKTPFFNAMAQEVIRRYGERNVQDDQIIKQQILTQLKWLGYLEIKSLLSNIPEIGVRAMTILEILNELRSPELKYQLSGLLFDTLSEETLARCLEEEEFKNLFSKKFSPLFQLVLTPLLFESSLMEHIIPILNSDYYQDVRGAKIALSSLFNLMKNSNLTNEEKIKILKIVFEEDVFNEIEEGEKNLKEEKERLSKLSRREKREGQKGIQKLSEKINHDKKALYPSVSKNLQMMEAIINIDCIEKLKEISSSEEMEQILQEKFVELTGIGEVENFAEKYLNTFASFRNSQAIFIYASKLKTLSSTEKEKVMAALKTYIEATLNGTLSTVRYQEEPGDHLFTVFSGREALKEGWMRGDEKNLSQLVPSIQEEAFDISQYLYQRVCQDAHVSVEEFPLLVSSLNHPSSLQHNLGILEGNLEQTKNQEERDKLLLQQGLIRLLSPNQTEEEKRTIFNSIKSLLSRVFPGEHQFKQDLKDLGAALTPKKRENLFLEKWKVVDTDDPQDLLMCGTDVLGSCQNINGNAQLNKCLLDYTLDGKNRLIAVKNEKGEIVARALMRILWDEKNQVPVLFKERTYSKPNLNPIVIEELNTMFIERSKALGLSLATIDSSLPEYSQYPYPLLSLNSKAPFEYVDATGGVTEGEFTINPSEVLEVH